MGHIFLHGGFLRDVIEETIQKGGPGRPPRNTFVNMLLRNTQLNEYSDIKTAAKYLGFNWKVPIME